MIIRALGPTLTTVDALADLTGASPVTIRRDLADLEGHGLVRRIHGGAVQTGKRGEPMPHALRVTEDREHKQALAAAVSALIEPNQTVVLDNGTTMIEVAHTLAGRPLTALCLSLHAAVALGSSRETQLIVPGGAVACDTLSSATPAAIAALQDLRADIALLGACAASPAHGLTTTTWDDAQIKRAAVVCSARRILVVTGTKLQRTSSFRFADADDLDDLVTTDDVPDALLQAFRDRGVRTHVASPLP